MMQRKNINSVAFIIHLKYKKNENDEHLMVWSESESYGSKEAPYGEIAKRLIDRSFSTKMQTQ